MKYVLLVVIFMSSISYAKEVVVTCPGSEPKGTVCYKKVFSPKKKTYNAKVTETKDERVVYITKTVEKEKIVTVKEQHKLNSLSLIGGATPTGVNATQVSPTQTNINSYYKPDVGLMFQHDFGDIRGTVEGTVQGNMYLGVGVNF